MQTQDTTPATANSHLPQAKAGKYPLISFLPAELQQELPAITKARISQSILKHSSESDRQKFAQSVLIFLNPKFESEEEGELAFKILMDFSAISELTAKEFIFALNLCADGKLSLDHENGSTPVKLFREIDRLKLGEVQQAFLQYRNRDKLNEQAEAKIKAFLNPEKPISEEEKQAQNLAFLKSQFKELLQCGTVSGAILFYDKIRQRKKFLNWNFVDKFLVNFNPERFASPEQGLVFARPPRREKVDAHLAFKEAVVASVIEKHNLKNATEKEWIQFWADGD